jgi:predicted ATPase
LPYGTGITWWCFAEMLRADAGIRFSDDNAAALSKLDVQLERIVNNDDRQAVRARLLVILGLATEASNFPGTGSSQMTVELAWAIRHYMSAAALTRPVVAVIDDLQWAEASVVETIQQLAERVTDVPLLLVCVARPELVENNPLWGSGRLNATSLSVEPLNRTQTTALISSLLPGDGLPDDLIARIVDRSEGTPLYCEELLRMMIDDGRLALSGDGWTAMGKIDDIEVPRSIQAVLAARLDVLDPDEKLALHAASVVGERFERAELEVLVAGPVGAAASRLIRKGLWLEDRERRSGEGFRFHHLLIRDAAYETTSKSDRAALHERFGLYLEDAAGDPNQYVDIAFHHAERAFSLSQELRLKGQEAERRAQHLFRAGSPSRTRCSGELQSEQSGVCSFGCRSRECGAGGARRKRGPSGGCAAVSARRLDDRLASRLARPRRSRTAGRWVPS